MEQNGREATPDTVVGERPPVNRRAVAIGLILLGLATAWSITRQQYLPLVLFIFFVIRAVLGDLRPASVVSRGGIRRPLRPRSAIGWADVHAVIAPRAGVPMTRLKLVTGKEVLLDDVPAARSAEVAALGGKPVEPAARPAMPPARTAASVDKDAAFDVHRRAAALSAEWRRMELENPARRPVTGAHGGGDGDR